MPSAPAAPTTPRTRRPSSGRPVRVGIACIAAGIATVAIQECWVPLAIHQLLRDWVMHATAVVATTLATGLVLGVASDPDAGLRRYRIAAWVPFVLLALHELGQWTWPDGPRDAFDSLRDLGLNALGAWLAARLLRASMPR